MRLGAWLTTAFLLALTGCGGSSGKAAPSTPAPSTSMAAPATTTPAEPKRLRGCVPACIMGLTRPGEVRAGRYRTAYFLDGFMRLRFPKGWAVTEDSSGELSSGRSGGEFHVEFWVDIYPTKPGKGLEKVPGVPNTAKGLLGWLRSDPNLVVGPSTAGSIGKFPATVADVAYGGKQHLLVAAVEGANPRDLRRRLKPARPILASVEVPATAA